MRKQTNTLSPSPKGFQSPKFSDLEKSADSDVRKALGYSVVEKLKLTFLEQYFPHIVPVRKDPPLFGLFGTHRVNKALNGAIRHKFPYKVHSNSLETTTKSSIRLKKQIEKFPSKPTRQ
jgi:hypothetical protein